MNRMVTSERRYARGKGMMGNLEQNSNEADSEFAKSNLDAGGRFFT